MATYYGYVEVLWYSLGVMGTSDREVVKEFLMKGCIAYRAIIEYWLIVLLHTLQQTQWCVWAGKPPKLPLPIGHLGPTWVNPQMASGLVQPFLHSTSVWPTLLDKTTLCMHAMWPNKNGRYTQTYLCTCISIFCMLLSAIFE